MWDRSSKGSLPLSPKMLHHSRNAPAELNLVLFFLQPKSCLEMEAEATESIDQGSKRTKPTPRFSPLAPQSGRALLCSVPSRSHPTPPQAAPPLGKGTQGSAARLTPPVLSRAFLRMLFPEKLDVDKKGRPSTAGSKIKVGPGPGRSTGHGQGCVCLSSSLHPSLARPGASAPFSGTLCAAQGSSLSSGTWRVGPVSLNSP